MLYHAIAWLLHIHYDRVTIGLLSTPQPSHFSRRVFFCIDESSLKHHIERLFLLAGRRPRRPRVSLRFLLTKPSEPNSDRPAPQRTVQNVHVDRPGSTPQRRTQAQQRRPKRGRQRLGATEPVGGGEQRWKAEPGSVKLSRWRGSRGKETVVFVVFFVKEQLYTDMST